MRLKRKTLKKLAQFLAHRIGVIGRDGQIHKGKIRVKKLRGQRRAFRRFNDAISAK